MLQEPRRSISLHGQVPTWLADADRPNVLVRYSPGRRLGPVGHGLDGWHEAAHRSTHGPSRVPAIGRTLGAHFRQLVSKVRVETLGDCGQVSWHPSSPDMYVRQWWRITGSMAQSMKEDWAIANFTTTSS